MGFINISEKAASTVEPSRDLRQLRGKKEVPPMRWTVQ
jgi:hypothetical protein